MGQIQEYVSGTTRRQFAARGLVVVAGVSVPGLLRPVVALADSPSRWERAAAITLDAVQAPLARSASVSTGVDGVRQMIQGDLFPIPQREATANMFIIVGEAIEPPGSSLTRSPAARQRRLLKLREGEFGIHGLPLQIVDDAIALSLAVLYPEDSYRSTANWAWKAAA